MNELSITPNSAEFMYDKSNGSVIVNFKEHDRDKEDTIKSNVMLSFTKQGFSSLVDTFVQFYAKIVDDEEGESNNGNG